MIQRKSFGIKRAPRGSKMPTTRRRRKTGELTKLKKILWQLCRTIQINKYGKTCFTCARSNLEGGNCQLGHFITSSTCSVELRYDLKNLRIQCYHCNINLSGNWVVFERNLVAEGGDVSELKARNEATKGQQYPLSWFHTKISEYQELLSTSE